MPMARAFCASIAIGVSTSPCTVIMRSAISSMTTTMYGSMPPLYVVSSNATSGCFGSLSGAPSCTRLLKSWTLRQPFAASSS